MKNLRSTLVGLAALAVSGGAITLLAADKPGIEDVMHKAFKGKQSLVVRVADGKASADEAKSLLEYVKALDAANAPKGDQAAWKKKTGAIVKAAEGVVAGNKEANEQLRAATNCKACHDDHKPD